MPILNGLSTDYGGENSTFIVTSTITKGVYAIDDIDATDVNNPMNLNLGASGSVNISVDGGIDTNGIEEHLEIKYGNVRGDDVFQIEAAGNGGSKGIAITPSDPYATVHVGNAEINSDLNTLTLSSHERTLLLDTPELLLNGAFAVNGDFQTNGSVFSTALNIHTSNVGYSMQINDRGILEIIKYNSNLNSAQLVGHFGTGYATTTLQNFDIPEYSASGQSANAPSSGSSGTSGGQWFVEGNNIYFPVSGQTNSYVGINTSNPLYDLDVRGKIAATEFVNGSLRIQNNNIVGASNIELNGKLLINTGEFDGTIQSLQGTQTFTLSQFSNDLTFQDLTSTGAVWFDAAQSTIPLSQFSNDIAPSVGTTNLDSVYANDVKIQGETGSVEFTASTSISRPVVTRITPNHVETTNSIVAGTLSVAGGVVFENNVNANSLLTTSAIIEDTLSVGQSVRVNTNLSIGDNAFVEGTISTQSVHTSNLVTMDLNVIQKMIADEVASRLAVFNDVHTSNIVVNNHVESDLVPDSANSRNLGSATQPWNSLYVSGQTIYLGDITLKQGEDTTGENILDVPVQIKSTGVVFPDQTRIKSTREIADAISSGGVLSDFTEYQLTLNINGVSRLKGSFAFDTGHDAFLHTNAWTALDFNNNSLVPIDANGYVNKSKANAFKEGLSPGDVTILFRVSGVNISEQSYISSKKSQLTLNDLYKIRKIDPFSETFKNQLAADFFTYYNFRLVADGLPPSTVTVHSKIDDGTKIIYGSLINSTSYSEGRGGAQNGGFEVEIMYKFKSPLFTTAIFNTQPTTMYLIPVSQQARKTKIYRLNLFTNQYEYVDVHDDFGLFPGILITHWDNSANDSDFTVPILDSDMGWGTTAPDTSVIFRKYDANGWLLELFKITYLYLQYGDCDDPHDNDPVIQNISTHYSNLVSYNSIKFVHVTELHPDDEPIETVPTNTPSKRIVLEHHLFDTLITS